MSSNRLSYDKCSYKAALQQSVAPIDYMMDPIKYEHCSKCRMELGIVGGTAVSHITGNLDDLENDLRGQTRPITHCPDYLYTPPDGNILESKNYIKCTDGPEIDLTMNHLPSCQMIDYAEVPRASQPKTYSCNKQ